MDDRITLEELDLEREMKDGFTAKYARRKAREIAGLVGLTGSDVDDVAQDLMIAVLERREKFDPAVAHWNAFAATIVEREVARILKVRRAEKRGGRAETISLATMVEDEEGVYVELDRILVEEDGDRLSGLPAIRPCEDVDWEHDFEVLMDRLPDDLRELCLRLRTRSVTQVIDDLELTRSAVRHRLSQIRAYFEEHGFGKMFE